MNDTGSQRLGPAAKAARAVDPRPARTRAMILDAVERLGSQGRELTVASVVEEAELSRSSFYTQFRDLGDIAVQLFEELHEDIVPNDAKLRESTTGRYAARTALTVITEELKLRRYLYAAALGAVHSARATHRIAQIMVQGVLPAVRRTAPKHIDAEQTAVFIAGATLSSLIFWLQERPERSASEVREEIIELLPTWLTTA